MGFLALALGFCTAFWLATRGGWAGLSIEWPDRKFWAFGALAAAAIFFFFGPFFGPCLIATFYFQELGHVVTLRSFGVDAKIRAIPVFANPPKWDLHKLDQGKEAYVALMGPAFTVPAVFLCLAIAAMLLNSSPLLGNYLAGFAAVSATYGAFTLLPFWPMAGGRIIRAVSETFWPILPFVLGGAALAVILTLAAGFMSFTLGAIAFIGIRGLMALEHPTPHQSPMPKDAAWLLIGAYLVVTASLYRFGWPLIVLALGL